MNGLELARGYYEDFGKPMLEAEFADILPYLAAGFTGSGSEHYGFDDEVSRDHDFEPGFCLFLPGEELVDRRRAFLLERAYAKLPKEYAGVKRLPISPVGGNRNGVFRTADYFSSAVGTPDGRLSLDAWLRIPDHVLAEAVNGELFFDSCGEVTAIRERLSRMPEDVRRKRLAGNLLLMGQAGQYNFARCLRHGEAEAAQLACHDFVTAAMKTWFLLHGAYMPYYKWSFRALRRLDGAGEIAEKLSSLLFGDIRRAETAAEKERAVEEIAALVIAVLRSQGLSSAESGDLERHAYAVNDSITDSSIRYMNILVSV